MQNRKLKTALGLCALLIFASCQTAPKTVVLPDELIGSGYFTLTDSNEKGRYGPVFIFPEWHNSRLIQAEVSWAMDILREQRGINSIALEGMYQGEVMSAEKMAYSTEIEKYTVLLALFERGEIKAPELMYLARDSFVFGIENEAQYAVEPPADDDIDEAFFKYFYMSITIELGREAMDAIIAGLPDTAKDEEILDLLLSSAPWTRETFEIVYSGVRSDKEIIERLEALEQKVAPVSFLLDAKTKVDFKQLVQFYKTSYQRSLTMAEYVYNTLQKKNEPLFMVIGAAHTKEITAYFRKNKVNYYVLEPRGLYNTIWSDLSAAEYVLKTEGKPLLEGGSTHGFFNNDKNSRITVNKPWFFKEQNFAVLTERMIYLATSKQNLKDQDDVVFVSNEQRINRNSLSISNPSDIKFMVENEKGKALFVRAVPNPRKKPFGSFQKELVEMIERLYQIDEKNLPFEQKVKAYGGVIQAFNQGAYTIYISPSNELFNIDLKAL